MAAEKIRRRAYRKSDREREQKKMDMKESDKLAIAEKFMNAAVKLKAIYMLAESEKCSEHNDGIYAAALVGFKGCLQALEIPLEIRKGKVYLFGQEILSD